MVEKIKAWLDAIKEFLLYIVGPIVFVGGVLYGFYIRSKSAQMEKKLQQAQQQIAGAITTAQQAGKVATDDEAEYERVKRAYLDNGPDSLGDGHGNKD